MKNIVNNMSLLEYLKGEQKLTKELYKNICWSLDLEYQWENILIIRDLPLEWTQERIKKLICKVCKNRFARILDPKMDVTFPVVNKDKVGENGHEGVCILIFDQWEIHKLQEDF